MARGVKPECRYGHGLLKLVEPPLLPNEDDSIRKAFFALAIYGQRVDLGRGYSFEIWECPQCSYIELHDAEAPVPGQS